MWEPFGQSIDLFIVVEAIEGAEVGENFFFVGVFDETEQIFEVSQDGEEVRWESIHGYILQGTDLDALPLVEQDCDLIVRETIVRNYTFGSA